MNQGVAVGEFSGDDAVGLANEGLDLAADFVFGGDEEGDVDLADEVDAEVRVEAGAGRDVVDAHERAEAAGEVEPGLGQGEADHVPRLGGEVGREERLDAGKQGDVVRGGGLEPGGGEDVGEAGGAGVAGLVSEDGHEALAGVELEAADVDAVEGGIDRVVEDLVGGRAEGAALEGLGDGAVDGGLDHTPDVEAEELEDGQDRVDEPSAVDVEVDGGAVVPLRAGGRLDLDGGAGLDEVHGAGDADVVRVDAEGAGAVEERDVEAAVAEAGAELDLPLDGPRAGDGDGDLVERPVEGRGVRGHELADLDVEVADGDSIDGALAAGSGKAEAVSRNVDGVGDGLDLGQDDDVEEVSEEAWSKGEGDADGDGLGRIEDHVGLLLVEEMSLVAEEELLDGGFIGLHVFVEIFGRVLVAMTTRRML